MRGCGETLENIAEYLRKNNFIDMFTAKANT